MNPKITIKLNHPIIVDGVSCEAIHLRRPKVRDRLAAEKMGDTASKQEIALIALIAEIAPQSVEDLDMSDYANIQEALKGFFSPT